MQVKSWRDEQHGWKKDTVQSVRVGVGVRVVPVEADDLDGCIA